MHQNGDFDHQIDGKKSPTFFASTPIYDSSKVAHLGRARIKDRNSGTCCFFPCCSCCFSPCGRSSSPPSPPSSSPPCCSPPEHSSSHPASPHPFTTMLIAPTDCFSASNGVQLTNSHKPLKTSSPRTKIVINAHCQKLRGRLRRRSEQY